MRGRWFALVTCLAGCGGGGNKPDAPIDEPAARCDPNGAFGAPALVTGINSDLDDAAARLSDDELEITFSRRTGGLWDLWRASRASIEEPFGAPALLTTVNSVSSELWPTLTPDGLTLVFEADRTTPGIFHIWRSTRTSKAVPFGPPAPRGDLRDNDTEPMLANERALYFTSAMRGGLGLGEILRAPVETNGAIGMPELLVGGVNSDTQEDSAAVTADERVIYFRRTSATGEPDLYTASRSTPTDGFGTAVPVPGLAEPNVSESPNWISPDGCHLYGHSNATSGPAGQNIWMASRPPPPE